VRYGSRRLRVIAATRRATELRNAHTAAANRKKPSGVEIQRFNTNAATSAAPADNPHRVIC
jgi:hypothetical protein